MILRPYQDQSIESLREGFRAKHIRQVLAAPTGSGKSVIAVAMIQSAIEKNSRVLFICERRVLVEQFSKHLDAIGIEHGILMAQHWRWRPNALVQVASAQTLERMETWPKFDIVFLDELHVMMRKSVIAMIKAFPDTRIVGMTATPFNPKIPEHFTSVSNVVTMKELVDEGHLVPFRVFIAHEIDTKGIKVSMGEWQKDQLESAALKVVGDVVSDYIQISQGVFGRNSKAICFSAGIAHGAELVLKFNEAGVNAVQLTCNDDNEYKADVLSDFAKCDSAIDMLISADILTRGYDQTDIEHVIMARPLRKSFSTVVQMVGRGARPHEGKEFCVVQDNSGNWLRFRDSWEDLYHSGVTELSSLHDSKARKEPTDKEKKENKCPRCHALWPGNADTCTHCGYKRKKKSLAITVPGEMIELTNTRLKKDFTADQKQAWYSQFLYLENTWKVKRYWAYAQFIKKFGHKPHGYTATIRPASREVIGWAKSGFIANANRRIS